VLVWFRAVRVSLRPFGLGWICWYLGLYVPFRGHLCHSEVVFRWFHVFLGLGSVDLVLSCLG